MTVPDVNIMQLHGLGAEIWDGVDAQEYVNALRDEWAPAVAWSLKDWSHDDDANEQTRLLQEVHRELVPYVVRAIQIAMGQDEVWSAWLEDRT